MAVALGLLLLAGCASSPPHDARTWLDETTAVTATAQEPPAVLARAEPMRATNARDYAQIGAVEINRMGARRYYLLLLSWSTIDRSAGEREAMQAALARITLWVDDRPLELARVASGRSQIGLSGPAYQLPTPQAVESWYPIDARDLPALAAADALQLTASGGEGDERRYREWRSGKAGFTDFLARVPSPR